MTKNGENLSSQVTLLNVEEHFVSLEAHFRAGPFGAVNFYFSWFFGSILFYFRLACKKNNLCIRRFLFIVD